MVKEGLKEFVPSGRGTQRGRIVIALAASSANRILREPRVRGKDRG